MRVARESPTPVAFSSLAKYMKKTYGGIMIVGKHCGRFFTEVEEESPDYCAWALELEDPGEPFRPFIGYLKTKEAKEEQTNKTGACKICYDAAIETVLVPCGHMACCKACQDRFDGEPCPICKAPVSLVLKTYAA